MRVAEFLHWNPPDQCRWQLIDGKPTPKSLANRTQGALHAEISTLLRNHLAGGARACFVLMSIGVIPRLRPDINFRVADVAVTFTGYEEEQYAVSDATLSIEILSPPTTQRPGPTSGPTRRSRASGKSSCSTRPSSARTCCAAAPTGPWPKRPIALSPGDDLMLESIGFRVPLTAAYATTRLAVR